MCNSTLITIFALTFSGNYTHIDFLSSLFSILYFKERIYGFWAFEAVNRAVKQTGSRLISQQLFHALTLNLVHNLKQWGSLSP